MGLLPGALLACLFLGMLLGWKQPQLLQWLVTPLIRWGVPLSLAALLLRADPSVSLIRAGLFGLATPLFCLILVWLPPLRMRMDHPLLRLGAAFGNTGYWGLPVAVVLLPPEAFAAAAIYDAAGTLVTWSAGPMLLRGRRTGWPHFVSALAASPAIQGAGLALLMWFSPWHAVFAQVLWWPARLVYLVALLLVGMRVGLSLTQRDLLFSSSGLPWALVFKLLVLPTLVWLFVILLGLPLWNGRFSCFRPLLPQPFPCS